MKATKKQAGKRSGRGGGAGGGAAPKRAYASALAAWFAECDRHGMQWHKPLRAELKALLGVAKAARDMRARARPIAMSVEEFLRPEHANLNTQRSGDYETRLHRALARLSRAGGER